MRRYSILITMMLSIMLIFTGCSLENGDYYNEDATSEESQKQTLSVWCWTESFNIYAMKKAAQYYQKEHKNFEIQIEDVRSADVEEKLMLAHNSGDISSLPDIVLLQDNSFQKCVINQPELFVDITNSGIDFSEFASGKAAYSVVDGKNYGVPFDNGAVIACYRTDILKQAGYSIEDLTDITWDEFIVIGKDILEKTGHPLNSVVGGESDLIMMMLQSAGASLFEEEGEPDIAENEVLKKVIAKYMQMLELGIIDSTDDVWGEYIDSFQSGRVAGVINGCWILSEIQEVKEQSGLWQVTNMPRMTEVDNATNYSNNGGASWTVTANCKDVDLACDFLHKTFAGDVAFYADILPSTGAIATWAPAAGADVYGNPNEYFGEEAIFQQIVDYAGKVPSNNTGLYYYEARDAVTLAVTNILNGADMEAELKTAQETVESYMK